MDAELNLDALRYIKRKPQKRNGVDYGEAMAMSLLYNRRFYYPDEPKISTRTIAKAFNRSQNTVYYRAITGEAKSYPARSAIEINADIKRIGFEKLWDKYVTPEIRAKVNAVAEAGEQAIRRRKR